MIKRQDKFARAFIILLFAITIIATGLCAGLPFVDAHVPQEELSLMGKNSKPNEITISGKVENTTDFKLDQITLTIKTYDENLLEIKDETVIIKLDLEAKQSTNFNYVFTATSRETVAKAKVTNIDYKYQKFPWYLIAIPGLAFIFLVKQFFANRKYYFTVDGSKVVIFASWRKAGVIVDGVLIKEGTLPSFKAEVAQFNMKVAGHKLKFYTLNGDIIPSIRALVDDQEVKYEKVRQNLFVKMMDEGVVRGQGNITMKSKYETDGEAADKYNEERFNNHKEFEDDEEIEDLDDLLEDDEKINKPTPKPKAKTSNLVACPYCNTMNKPSSLKCSGCGANLKK